MFQLRADTVAFHDASEHTTDLPESHSVSLVTARPTLRGEEGDRKRTQREKSFDREGLLHTSAPADPRSINWAATARVSSGVVVNTYAKSALKLPTHHHLLIDASSWILDPTADLSAWEYRHVERFDTAALSRLSSYIQTVTTSGKKVSVSIYVFGTEVASLDPFQTARWALERCILSDDWAPGASAILGSLVSPNQSASSTQHGFAKYFDALSYKARGACDAFEVARLYTLALQGGCAISLMRPSSLAGDGGFGINDLLLHARLARSGKFSVVEI
jgi:hypothetical protein